MDLALFVKAFAALFAIMNPFVALPTFLALTTGMEVARQRRTGLRVALYSLVLSLVLMLGGSAILSFFGVSVDDFRIAGGIVLLMIGLGMLNGTGSTAHTGTADEQQHHAKVADPSFYPLAFPMIVGPGTIATLILLVSGAQGDGQSGGQGTGLSGERAATYLSVGLAVVAVLVILGVVLYFAGNIGHFLSQTLRTIMTRLMGMILAAIAVQMITAGAVKVFPGLT